MSIDYALIAIFRFMTGVALAAVLAWIAWKFVKNLRARGRSRRMRTDRRHRRVRVPSERRRGPRRDRELERRQAEEAVKSAVESTVLPGSPPGPR